MSRAGGSPTTHPYVKHLAIIAVVFVVMILSAILGPPWVGYFALPVMIVGVIYGAIVLARWMIKGPKRIVAYGVALVLLALVGGCYADMRTAVGPEETKRGCHADYYLRVIPVAFYCFD
jgi:energy-coupling factor transporter transmembrane protein EcfT